MGFKENLANWLEKRVDLAEVKTISDTAVDSLYFKALAVEIATSYLANVVSQCEFKVFHKGEEVKDTMYYILNVSPNNNETATQLKQKIIHNLVYDGECLVIPRNNQLFVADSFSRNSNPFASDTFENIRVGKQIILGTMRAEQVFYFKLHDKNIKDLIDSLFSDYDKIVNVACSSYRESGYKEKYKLVLDGVKTGDTEFEKQYNEVIKKQLKDFMNSRKAIYPQFKGTNLEKFEERSGRMSTDSSDILNLRKEAFELVAEAFKMPISLLYGNMTNVKDIFNAWITTEVGTFFKLIEEELTRKTGAEKDFRKGTFVKIDSTQIYHMDLMDIADGASKLIASGIYCVDEVREKLGENRLNTEFSQSYWITKNYTKAEIALNEAGGEKENGN